MTATRLPIRTVRVYDPPMTLAEFERLPAPLHGGKLELRQGQVVDGAGRVPARAYPDPAGDPPGAPRRGAGRDGLRHGAERGGLPRRSRGGGAPRGRCPCGPRTWQSCWRPVGSTRSKTVSWTALPIWP